MQTSLKPCTSLSLGHGIRRIQNQKYSTYVSITYNAEYFWFFVHGFKLRAYINHEDVLGEVYGFE